MNTQRATPEAVRNCLRSIDDPHMGLNIVDLGFVTDVRVADEGVVIDLTLANPDSPLAGRIATEAEQAVREAFEDVPSIEVGFVWDPAWSFDRLSDEAKSTLGYTATG